MLKELCTELVKPTKYPIRFQSFMSTPLFQKSSGYKEFDKKNEKTIYPFQKGSIKCTCTWGLFQQDTLRVLGIWIFPSGSSKHCKLGLFPLSLGFEVPSYTKQNQTSSFNWKTVKTKICTCLTNTIEPKSFAFSSKSCV